jgi:hypothetical protein
LLYFSTVTVTEFPVTQLPELIVQAGSEPLPVTVAHALAAGALSGERRGNGFPPPVLTERYQ